MNRQLAIGDIHGGLKALKQLLKRAEVSKEDHLIFLGDYVDGWSESAQTLDYLMSLEEKYTCTFIRGNHDTLLLDWLEREDLNPKWLRHGGESSMKSYENHSKEERKKHIDFLQGLENYYVNKDNQLFLHAGFQNQNGPEFEWNELAFFWDRTLWEMVVAINPEIKPGDTTYPKRLTHYSEIFIGHTPTTRVGSEIPAQRATVWNLDTGAAFKGALSIMDVTTKKFWQSDPVFQLYPDENGRNGG